MFKSILTAAIVSVGLASAAIALPAAPSSSQLSVSSDVIQVKKEWNKKGNWNNKNNWNSNKNWSNNRGKKGNWKYGKRNYNNRNFYAGRSYNYRYSSRPYGWQARGCILAGPIWLCP